MAKEYSEFSDPLPPAIFIMGPTASGKTGVAVDVFLRLPVEIISVDSAQIYRHMDAGTAKPEAAVLAAAPHHLINIVDPTERYSAARFCDDALKLMEQITQRGNIPMLVGGTMLYFKALREGLSELPGADPATRLVIDTMASEAGWPALHAELGRFDPETAARLEPTDSQRIQRALEVYYLSGRPMSELLRQKPEKHLPYRVIAVSLTPGDRAVLHRRIEKRFLAMLDGGLIEEVLWLREQFKLDPSLPSMRCVGYRQVWEYLAGKYDYDTMTQKGIAATRQLAKRQLTWLKQMEGVEEFDCLGENLSAKVIDFLQSRC